MRRRLPEVALSGARALVTSTPAKMAAVSEMPGSRSASTSGGRWFRCRYTWSLLGPQPRPSRISSVMLRDTTSREARSLAVGAYLRNAPGLRPAPQAPEEALLALQLR